MICVCCKCLSTFLTWAMKASLCRVVEQVLSATKPNAKTHNTVTKPSLILRDRDRIETPENTWATGFRYVTNSLQKNSSQMKLCLFRPRRAALPSCKLLADQLKDRSCQSKRWTYIACDIAVKSHIESVLGLKLGCCSNTSKLFIRFFFINKNICIQTKYENYKPKKTWIQLFEKRGFKAWGSLNKCQ